MSELGQFLKKARMDKKISLQDLEESTKIRKRYLEAIEEGNYKILPGSFYVRAFIKNYAEAVGLDPVEVLGMYQHTVPSSSIPDKPSNSNLHNKRRFSRSNDKMSRIASSAMVIGFVILILGLIYYYAFQSSKGGTPSQVKTPDSKSERITDRTDLKAGQASTSPSAVATTTHAPTPSPTPTPTTVPTLTAVKFNKSEKGVDFYTVTGSQRLNIQMKISSSDCWIQVDTIDVNGKKAMQKQKTYKDGETDSFVFDSSAYLNVGAAKALELSVNGTIVTVGDSLNPKRIQLDLQKS